jgi:hypothetical protein
MALEAMTMAKEKLTRLGDYRIKSLLVLAVLLVKKPTKELPLKLREFAREATALVSGQIVQGNQNLVMKPDTPEKNIAPLNDFFEAVGWNAHLVKDDDGIYFDCPPTFGGETKETKKDIVLFLLTYFLTNHPSLKDPLSYSAIGHYLSDHGYPVLTPYDLQSNVNKINSIFNTFDVLFHLTCRKKVCYFDATPISESSAALFYDFIAHSDYLAADEKNALQSFLYFASGVDKDNPEKQIFLTESEKKEPWAALPPLYARLQKAIEQGQYLRFGNRMHLGKSPFFYRPLCLVKAADDYLLYSLEIPNRKSEREKGKDEAKVMASRLNDLLYVLPYEAPKSEQEEIDAYVTRFGGALRDNDDLDYSIGLDQFNAEKAHVWDPEGRRNWISFNEGKWDYEEKQASMVVLFTGAYPSKRLIQAFGVHITFKDYDRPQPPFGGWKIVPSDEMVVRGNPGDLIAFALAMCPSGIKILSPENLRYTVLRILRDSSAQYPSNLIEDYERNRPLPANRRKPK